MLFSGTEESLVDYAEEIYGFITSYTGVREAERLVLRVGVSNSIVPSNVIRAVTEGPEAEGEAEAEVEVEAEVEEEPEAESETESEPEGEHISTILLGNIGETTLPPKDGKSILRFVCEVIYCIIIMIRQIKFHEC